MTISLSQLGLRAGAAAAVAGFATVALTVLPASAHVHVQPDNTASGGYAALTFRVPNESDTASTTTVVVTLPQKEPLANVSVRPVAGWTATVTDAALPQPVTANGTTLTRAPRTVTWTATSARDAVAPGEYQEFSISAGPLPAPGMLVLPVAQTYSDGTVVTWDTPQTAGEDEPEHPAPQFEVTAASGGDEHAGHDQLAAAATQASGSGSTSDPFARVLAGGALLVAAVGVGLQALAGRRRRTVSA